MVDIKQDSLIFMANDAGTSEVALAGWSITRDLDKMTTQWSIDLAEAVQVNDEALFTIKRGIAPASYIPSGSLALSSSYGTTLLRNLKPDEWTVEIDDRNMGWGCSGKMGESSYIQTQTKGASAKDLYFVNPTWLTSLAGGIRNWQLIDGALYWQIRSSRPNTSGTGTSTNRKAWPIEHTDLPPKSAKPGTFTILMNYTTHHEIAAYIAQLMGYKIKINTPNLQVRSALHFSSSQGYLEILDSLFKIWNADIRFDESDSDNPTIWVLDTAGPENTLTQPATLVLQEQAIKSLSVKYQGIDQNPIDHVIVKGSKNWNSGNIPDPGEIKSFRLMPIEFPEKDLFTYWWTESFEFANENKILGDYTGGFNTADAEPKRRPKYVYRSETWYISPIDDGLYIIAENDESFDDQGMLHAHSVHYFYGAGFKLIYTGEKEYALIQKPGEPFKTFDLIKHTIIDQSWQMDGLGRACTIEIVEEPVVVAEVWDANAQKWVKCAPVPINRSQEQGRTSKNPAANQKLIQMTTKKSVTKVNRACKGVLAQVKLEYDTLAEIMKVHPQFIRDPRARLDEESAQYHYEAWLPGQVVYHRSITIEHPDINSDLVAQAIADRVFAKNAVNVERTEVTITPVIPIPLPDTNFCVRLPDYYATSDLGNGRATRRFVKGQKYNVSRIQENAKASLDGKITHDQQLTLRNYL